jgi:hypothetical protein
MSGHDERPVPHRLLPGERILWRGRPCWHAVARDALHIRLLALYLSVAIVWGAVDDRSQGLGLAEAAKAAIPSLLLGLLVLGGCVALARAIARTTRYTVTSERFLMEFGVALQANLSLPWCRVAMVSLAVARDGTGSIPLTLKPGQALSALKLWPHVRLPRYGVGFGAAQPMLRGVPNAAQVGALIARSVRTVSPGHLMRLSEPEALPPLRAAPVVE